MRLPFQRRPTTRRRGSIIPERSSSLIHRFGTFIIMDWMDWSFQNEDFSKILICTLDDSRYDDLTGRGRSSRWVCLRAGAW